MDITDAIVLWREMGNSIVTWDNKKDNYNILFAKNGDVVGYIKVIDGGIFYDLPTELLKGTANKFDWASIQD